MAYEWLAGALADLIPLAQSYGLDWDYVLPGPATAAAIADAERQLGTTFPPSLRSFYLEHDGFAVLQRDRWDGDDRQPSRDDDGRDPWDGNGVHSLAELLAETGRLRREIGRDLDDPCVLDSTIAVVRGPGGYTILDTAVVNGDGECAIFWAGDGFAPNDWRSCELARSFALWLDDFFEKIVVGRRVPGIDTPMIESSWSARFHRRRGDEAAARGDRSAAWDAYLLAVRNTPFTPDAGEEILAALHRLDALTAADRFYLRLIGRALRTWVPALRTPFGLRSSYEQLLPSERTAPRPHGWGEASCPALLSTLARECTSFTLFETQRGSLAVNFPARQMRRVSIVGEAASSARDLIAIATVQVRPYGVPGPDHWLLVESGRPEVWRARAIANETDLVRSAFVFGEPTLVGADLDEFLDERLEAFLERAPSWL